MAPLRGRNKPATKNCGCMRIDSIIHSYSHLKSLAELLVMFSGSGETIELELCWSALTNDSIDLRKHGWVMVLNHMMF